MNDADCRAYLLGQLPETQAERLEERLLDDDETFQTLCGIEDDLIDDFARGRLESADRERFMARYGAQPDRLAFARAFARRAESDATARQPTRLVPRDAGRQGGRATIFWGSKRWMPLAAAATVLVAIGGSLLMRRPAPAPEPGPAIVRNAPPVAPTLPTAMFTVTLGSSRAPRGAMTVAVPANAATIELRVKLNPADNFDIYAMRLRSTDNRIVWSAENLRATASAGELLLSAPVPAQSLPNGAYELAVRGGTEDLGFVSLEVTRKP